MAESRIAESPDSATDSVDDRLLLTMPEPKHHNGYRVRLFGKRGPYAVILNGRNDKLTVHVSARRVKDYLDGHIVRSESGEQQADRRDKTRTT